MTRLRTFLFGIAYTKTPDLAILTSPTALDLSQPASRTRKIKSHVAPRVFRQCAPLPVHHARDTTKTIFPCAELLENLAWEFAATALLAYQVP
jgi:hypothetical protein